ncbi:DNA polymerase III subunit epsilon [Candidatus Hodgkinia cicadicola]|nr:DNA polymerase III subunit epsilon [Candidatus Hodgkinia cicadicola]
MVVAEILTIILVDRYIPNHIGITSTLITPTHQKKTNQIISKQTNTYILHQHPYTSETYLQYSNYIPILNYNNHTIYLNQHPKCTYVLFIPDFSHNHKPKPMNINHQNEHTCKVVIDTETTGLNQKHDRIVELAAIKVANGRTSRTFHSCFDPFPVKVNASAIAIHGLANEFLSTKPKS